MHVCYCNYTKIICQVEPKMFSYFYDLTHYVNTTFTCIQCTAVCVSNNAV